MHGKYRNVGKCPEICEELQPQLLTSRQCSFSQNEVRFLSSGRIAGKQEVSQLVDQGESNFRIARDSSEISGIATEFPFPQWSRCSDASQNGSYSSLVTLVFTKM
jgi:hypothetical protein